MYLGIVEYYRRLSAGNHQYTAVHHKMERDCHKTCFWPVFHPHKIYYSHRPASRHSRHHLLWYKNCLFKIRSPLRESGGKKYVYGTRKVSNLGRTVDCRALFLSQDSVNFHNCQTESLAATACRSHKIHCMRSNPHENFHLSLALGNHLYA